MHWALVPNGKMSELNTSGFLSKSTHSVIINKTRTVKDCLYGQVKIPPLCEAAMHTPEFQRLRFVRQLGVAHYVYPSAVHTRFEHSIGVMHLAGKMCKVLHVPQDKRRLIELGALFHDLGHMAYSHLFDEFLEWRHNSENLPEIFQHSDHEDRSVYLFRQINARLQLLTPEDEEFVVNVILGIIPDGQPPYLYEIVCNKLCGVDVDKMDYLQRDAYHTGMHGFQSGYVIQNAVVTEDGHLAFLEKARIDVEDIFATRHRMHCNVYRHRTTRKMDKLYWCMLYHLGDKLFTYGANTTDAVVEAMILTSTDPDIMSLLQSVFTRQLDHACDHCVGYDLEAPITRSGKIDQVIFL